MRIHRALTGIQSVLIVGLAFTLMIPALLFLASVDQVIEWCGR
jgi:hypothetical protein